MKALARWVSILLHPFACAVVLVAAVELRRGAWAAGGSVLVVALLFVLPLSLLIFRQVRRGSWTTVDASRPRERPLLYAAGVLAMLAMLAFLRLSQPDSPLLLGGAGALAMLAVCAVLTRWVKVSLHVAAASLTSAVLLRAGLPLGWVFAAALPLLAWARVALGRHRWPEVALGFAIGATAGAAIVASS